MIADYFTSPSFRDTNNDQNINRRDGSDKPTDRAGCRVVFVEDDYLTALNTVDTLEEADYDVAAVARTAEDAIQAVETEKPDLVVMDIRLPGKTDGIDAAIEIFKRFGVRVVFATAHTDEGTRRRAAPAKPLAWIGKPYSDRELLDVLARVRQRLE